MSNIDHTLDMAANIKGAFAVAIVDYESGMTLGSRGGSAEFDLDVAAPGNSEVMRAKLDVMQKLGLRNEGIEDVLITLSTQYHLIRPIQGAPDEKLFLYVALNKAGVPVEMHLYAQGGHAFGLRPSKFPVSQWPKLVEAWLASNGITAAR